jgi:uncharacterized protein (DUF2267 family)
LRGSGVVGTGLTGRTLSDGRSAFEWGLIGWDSAGGTNTISRLDETDNSTHTSTTVGRSAFAKAKVKEYVSELQTVLEYEDWNDAYNAMYATLNALEGLSAAQDRSAFLEKVAQNLPSYVGPEEAVRGVFEVLLPKVSNGEIEDFTELVPGDLLYTPPPERGKFLRTDIGDRR